MGTPPGRARVQSGDRDEIMRLAGSQRPGFAAKSLFKVNGRTQPPGDGWRVSLATPRRAFRYFSTRLGDLVTRQLPQPRLVDGCMRLPRCDYSPTFDGVDMFADIVRPKLGGLRVLVPDGHGAVVVDGVGTPWMLSWSDHPLSRNILRQPDTAYSCLKVS
jgi:hypothetical protein